MKKERSDSIKGQIVLNVKVAGEEKIISKEDILASRELKRQS
jgi:hypothetical protein